MAIYSIGSTYNATTPIIASNPHSPGCKYPKWLESHEWILIYSNKLFKCFKLNCTKGGPMKVYTVDQVEMEVN